MDVRMGFLHLVQQNHRIRFATHRLGQHTTLAVTDVARRRALERGDGMRLLELAHVDRDQVVLAAVKGLGQGQRGLGLAHARGTGEHEHADRLVRVVQSRARGLDASRDHRHRVILADHPLAHEAVQGHDRFQFASHHPADRDAGPVGHHRCHGLIVDARQDQGVLALQGGKLRLQRLQFGKRRHATGLVQRRLRPRGRDLRRRGLLERAAGSVDGDQVATQARAQGEYALDQRLFRDPVGLEPLQPRPFGLEPFIRGRLACGDLHPYGLLAGDDRQLGLQGQDALARIVDRRWHRVLADGDAGAGGVEQAHRLVRQLTGRNVAVRQFHRGFQRLVEYLHPVVVLHHAGDAAHHEDAPFPRRAHPLARSGSGGSRPGLSRCVSCTRPRSWRRPCAGCRGRARA